MKSASPDYPWLAQDVIDWLERVLRPFSTVLETGAGGSTVFFSKRAGHVISFENNRDWHAKVAASLKGVGNVDLRFDPAYPKRGLGELPPVDLAFIDGRGRVKSVEDALPLIKPGGYLVLDDSQRPWYFSALDLVEEKATSRIIFQSGADQTTAWRL